MSVYAGRGLFFIYGAAAVSGMSVHRSLRKKRLRKGQKRNMAETGKKKTPSANRCETCSNYVFDEDYEYYVCEASLDEDEMARFLSGSRFECPYYQLDDEYCIVRKQI